MKGGGISYNFIRLAYVHTVDETKCGTTHLLIVKWFPFAFFPFHWVRVMKPQKRLLAIVKFSELMNDFEPSTLLWVDSAINETVHTCRS